MVYAKGDKVEGIYNTYLQYLYSLIYVLRYR